MNEASDKVFEAISTGGYSLLSGRRVGRRGWFDGRAFHAALDAERQARRLTWKDVAAQSGVSASTLTRMSQGRHPDVDGLAALCAWSGLSADNFIRPEGGASAEVGALAKITTCLGFDPNLSPEAATALDEMIKATYERLRSDGG